MNGTDSPDETPSPLEAFGLLVKSVSINLQLKKVKKVNLFLVTIIMLGLVGASYVYFPALKEKYDSTKSDNEDESATREPKLFQVPSTGGCFIFPDEACGVRISNPDFYFNKVNGEVFIISKHLVASNIRGRAELLDKHVVVEGQVYYISAHSQYYEIYIVKIESSTGLVKFNVRKRG